MRVWEIIRIIEDSPVRAHQPETGDICFQTPEGHAYCVFFDCGEPDYLEWFALKGEAPISFWPESGSPRVTTAMAYLAGNLLQLPHVGERLKIACQKAAIIP